VPRTRLQRAPWLGVRCMNRVPINGESFTKFVDNFVRNNSRIPNRKDSVEALKVPGKFILEELGNIETISGLWEISNEAEIYIVDKINSGIETPKSLDDLANLLVKALLDTLPDIPKGDGPNVA